MCGIAGFIDYGDNFDEAVIRRMTASLSHRGPDDNGLLVNASDSCRVGLGHARLSILDLSPAGRQPMKLGDLTVVLNGEIYNFRELRRDLERLGREFSTQTDTEVLLHAFAEWGIACLERFIGMFAFCIHDADARRLFLVRDRAGVKPLFVYTAQGFSLFASELKAFHECPKFRPEVNLTDVRSFFDLGYVPDNRSIFSDCEKVGAGEYWQIDLSSGHTKTERYWSPYEAYQAPKLKIDYSEAIEELSSLLHSACSYRLVSDVPVGVFLSGGYDSTAVAAVLQSDCSSRVRTFTIGFTDGQDEAPFAREIARHLGTDHNELYCSEAEAQRVIPDLAKVFDEPFGDSSAIPTMLVSRMAREHVKVALSADAGDELFCGYDAYSLLHRRMKYVSRIPKTLRSTIRRIGEFAAHAIPDSQVELSHRANGFTRALSRSDADTGRKLHSYSLRLPEYFGRGVLGEQGVTVLSASAVDSWGESNGVEAAMASDYASYLKDDILVKVDRASMSVGLEAREPLVDHLILEFVARLPFSFKYDGTTQKKILKDIVHKHVPKELLSRPKMGFSLPIYSWLRGDLSYLLDELCSVAALSQPGFLNAKFLATQVDKFRENRLHYSPLIWRLVMFQAWHKEWMEDR